MGSGFDVLLCVVPSATGIGHEDGEGKAGHERTGEQAAERVDADESDDERHDHGEGARKDHFLERSFGRDGDATSRVRNDARQPFAQARNLAELATHFFDHLRCGTADGVDRESGKQERQCRANEESGEHVNLADVEVEHRRTVRGRRDGELEALEECECGQCGRANGESLGDCRRGVAEAVEGVGDFAHRRVQFGHLGDAAGIVCDRAVCIDGDDDAGGCEHADGGNGDAVEAADLAVECLLSAPVGDTDAGQDQSDRSSDGLHADADALEHGGRRSSFGLLTDFLHRLVVIRGVVLSGLAERPTDDQTANDRDSKAPRVVRGVAEDPVRTGEHTHGGDRHGHIRTEMQRLAEGLRVCRCPASDEERADNRSDHADERNEHREDEEFNFAHIAGLLGADRSSECNERDGSDDRPGVRLEQVGAHASDVADVVADVVGDGGRVARIILGDAGFDLADEVSADVGSLGEDAAANAGEQRDRRCTEAVGRHDLEGVVDFQHRDEHDVGAHEAEQCETGDGEAHHGAAAECDRKRLARTLLGRLGGASVGHSGHCHTCVAGGG